jgi:hypothetical protein
VLISAHITGLNGNPVNGQFSTMTAIRVEIVAGDAAPQAVNRWIVMCLTVRELDLYS